MAQSPVNPVAAKVERNYGWVGKSARFYCTATPFVRRAVLHFTFCPAFRKRKSPGTRLLRASIKRFPSTGFVSSSFSRFRLERWRNVLSRSIRQNPPGRSGTEGRNETKRTGEINGFGVDEKSKSFEQVVDKEREKYRWCLDASGRLIYWRAMCLSSRRTSSLIEHSRQSGLIP